jgi:hypothetical protein
VNIYIYIYIYIYNVLRGELPFDKLDKYLN